MSHSGSETSATETPDATTLRRSNKHYMLIAIKVVASFGLIFYLLRDTDLKVIFASITSCHLLLVVIALAQNFLGFIVSAARWKILLKTQGVVVPYIYLVKSCMVALFFNNFLPSTIGGDAVRAYDSWRFGKSKSGAVATIFVDRFLGLFALLTFATISILAQDQSVSLDIPFLRVWMVLGFFGMISILWLIFLPPAWVVGLIENLHVPFSGKLQSIVQRIVGAFMAFKGKKGAMLSALFLSFLLQTNVVIHYFVIAKSMDLPVPFAGLFLVVPLAIFLMMIPASINGIGIREAVWVYFLSLYGVGKEDAIAFVWIAFGLVLIQGVIGGIVYALRK